MSGTYREIAAALRQGLLRPGPDPSYADGDDATWTAVDWRAVTKAVEVDGTRVNVVDTGAPPSPAGSPIVWIHGLSGRWQNWLLNIPAFMDRHRCVALDLPGFGDSELPREPISIRGYARTVDLLLRQLGVERCVIVGNSMGGFVGAEVTLELPTLVERLVLVSAAGLSVEYLRREPLLAGARVLSALGTRNAPQLEQAVRRPGLRRAAMGVVFRYPERLSAPLAFEQIQGAGRPGFVPAMAALLSYSFRARLAEIEIPVLIVWGANDMIVPVGDAAQFERLIGANARKVIFEDTGHVPMLERPTRFNRLLEDFLAGAAHPDERVEGVRAHTTADEDAASSSLPGPAPAPAAGAAT